MGHRTRSRRATAVAVLLGVVVLGGCEVYVEQQVGTLRQQAGVGPVTAAPYLHDAAVARAQAMCAAGAAAPSADLQADYGGESAVALDELVGSAPLDPASTDPTQRNSAATRAVWEAWRTDPSLVDARWDEIGVGEHTCPDGDLYLAAVLRDAPSMPASGRYSSTIYTAAQIQAVTGLVYGTAVNYQGQTVNLLLDIYRPPADGIAEKPLVILIHGGGFSGGSRTGLADTASAYARRGFVVASIDYRLRPSSTYEELVLAATQAMDDGLESVRWLRANAATYGIDPGRMAALGTSAGGYISLAMAHLEDQTPGGPLGSVGTEIAAAMSTGASLSAGLDQVTFDRGDSPSLMFHYEQDTGPTTPTGAFAFQTCAAIRAAAVPCDFVLLAGSGHTISLSPTTGFWTSDIGPFLWLHLGLAG
jgi:pimeloyl-ACP methyl ester carboxylesterase